MWTMIRLVFEDQLNVLFWKWDSYFTRIFSNRNLFIRYRWLYVCLCSGVRFPQIASHDWTQGQTMHFRKSERNKRKFYASSERISCIVDCRIALATSVREFGFCAGVAAVHCGLDIHSAVFTKHRPPLRVRMCARTNPLTRFCDREERKRDSSFLSTCSGF